MQRVHVQMESEDATAVLLAAEAAVAGLHVLSSPDMPSQVPHSSLSRQTPLLQAPSEALQAHLTMQPGHWPVSGIMYCAGSL